MRHLACRTLLIVLLAAAPAHAYRPQLPVPLAQRVEGSSHIFVGQIRDVYCISTAGQRISPRQAVQEMNRALLRNHYPIWPTVETKVRITEPLLWRSGKLEQVILLREELMWVGHYQREHRVKVFGDILDAYKRDMGEKYVFLADRVAQRGRRTYFISKFESGSREAVTAKAAVQKAIKKLEGHSNRT